MSIVFDINIQGLTVGTNYSNNEAAFHKEGNPNFQVGSSYGDHIKCVNHPTQKDLKALEFLIQKSPNSFSQELHKGRAEVASSYSLGPSADYYFGFRIMFPSDFPTGAREFIFIQGGNCTDHPKVFCDINDDVISFPGGYKMSLVRNRWYAMEYRIKMGTTASTGKFQLWVDGVSRVDSSQQTSCTGSEPNNGEYMYKLGIYAYNWRYAPNDGPDSYRYFVDHLKMATTRAEVASVV